MNEDAKRAMLELSAQLDRRDRAGLVARVSSAPSPAQWSARISRETPKYRAMQLRNLIVDHDEDERPAALDEAIDAFIFGMPLELRERAMVRIAEDIQREKTR